MFKRIGGALALLFTPFFVFVGSTGLGTWAVASDAESRSDLAVEYLQGAVYHEGEHLGMPMGLGTTSSTIVVIDRFAENSIHVIDRTTGNLRASIGRKGEGPGEFKGASSIDRVAGLQDEVWVFDPGTQRLTRVDLSALHSDGGWAREFVSLRGSARVTSPVRTSSGELLAVGFFPEGRFGIFDQGGDQVDARGALPEWAEPIPPSVLQHAFMGTIKPDPARLRFAVGARHAGLLEIFDASGQKLARAQVPVEFEPRFTVNHREDRPPSMGSGDDLRFGYVDVATTEARIYGLFSGRLRGDYPKSAWSAREVHVFDWAGRLETIIHLDSDAIAIAVDEQGDSLYAIRHDPLPAIMRYELPDARGPRPVGSIAMGD